MRFLVRVRRERNLQPVRMIRAVLLFVAGTSSLLLTFSLQAQVGNDNPTGPAGLTGQITTGCSYSSYTGSAQRKITDLVVAGAVGNPLAFSRTSNSRDDIIDAKFGGAGAWRHSYDWQIDPSPLDYVDYYSVHFPDGRREVFSGSSSDTYWRAGPGTRERFQPFDNWTNPHFLTPRTLILPDGGKVEFQATIHTFENGAHWYFTYQATAIIDPYGLRTTLSYNGDGRLNTIQEPGGRWLQLIYVTTPWLNSTGSHDVVIDHVEASDGRVVQYTYGSTTAGGHPYTYLANVVYPSDSGSPSPVASYTYQVCNIAGYSGFYYNTLPLLSSCDDPMYEGPMNKISYTYATNVNPDGSYPAPGQILSENSGTTGQAVSTLTVNGATRTETRGDGPSRAFTYGDEGKLVSYTDFKGQPSNISYDGNGYTSAFEDARHHINTFLREEIIGTLSVLTHPDPEHSNQRFAYYYRDGAPYFLQIRGDERDFNSNTYFTRDGNFRVTRIDYPNGAYETFSYNGFGQVLAHRMTSGGTEIFTYDGRGLLTTFTPPATPSDPNPGQHPTRYYYYTSGPQIDRLWFVVDARGYSTSFEYNVRGQVTKVTHDQDGTYAQSGYNLDGTLAWTADENHPGAATDPNQRTRYIYDDYKRVLTVTNPMNETTTNYYGLDWSNPLLHTTNNVKYTISPMYKNVVFDYDENLRKLDQVAALGTADEAWTLFRYDEVGNLASVRDPRGNLTTFAYDERNRRISATNPAPFDNQVTRWEYDTRSNLTKETRPDLLYRRLEYDPMSRVIDTYGFANEHTHLERDLSGNVLQMTDPKPSTYFFGYDAMNRKISATYPMDATQTVRGESWHYDFAGNMDQYTNPAGQIKTLGYDTRNRLYSSFWNAGGGPTVGFGYYNASQLAIVVTYVGGNPETTVVFGYDDANRQTWEEQTVAGFPMRRVETPRDADGNRSSLNVPGGLGLQYDYTQRNQLWHIKDASANPWFTYTYDSAGNMTRRQDVQGGVNDSTNVMDGNGASQYDQLNRPLLWEQTGTLNGVSNTAFALSHFQYDNLSRLKASWRDEQAGKGESFGYDATGQLTDVSYNADGVSIGPPQNASRTVNYAMTADTLNRTTMTDSGDLNIYTPNALNQYTDINGGGLYYDDKFNLMWTGGFSAGYDSENHLTTIGNGEDNGQFTYDGLGRCVKRTIDWETILITYDGWKPIVEWDEWNGLKAWNIYGPGPDEILYRHDAYLAVDLRYHLDRMGNVVFLLDSNGNGLERYTYDAFGTPTVTDWNGNNPRPYSWYGNRFMFTGREYFSELGLYDYRNRFYYPVLGRFLQSDPTGFDAADMNLYRYCGGDPMNGSDPSGLETIYGYDDTNGRGPRVTVTGTSIDDPDREAGLFDLWNNATLREYYSNSIHDDLGLREGLNSAAASPSVPPLPTATPTLPPGALGTVTQVINDVRLLPNNAPPIPATVGMNVFRGDALVTGRNSRAEFTYFNGYLFRMGSYTIFNPGMYRLGPAYTPTPDPIIRWPH
jgi:RHS repeat-associated protein